MSTLEKNEEFVLNIKIGNDVIPTTKARFLRDLWTDTFDSLCMVCSQDFNIPRQPPVRTISITIDQGAGTLSEPDPSCVSIQIYNRHLNCIMEHKIQYFPVSHVWHQRVALAHLSGLSNDDAEHLVYDVPFKVLIAVSEKLGPGIELWHDYVSVPQWRKDTQQRLLLQLPQIYSYANVVIIHLDDFSTDSIKQVYRTASSTTYALSPEERYQEIAKFYNSQWHTRMWVALELANSKEACILTEDHTFIRGEGVFGDSFFFFLHYFKNAIKDITRELGTERFMELFLRHQIRELDYVRSKDEPSFGDIFALVAKKECSVERDRYLAIASFLRLGSHEELCEQFWGKSSDEVCEWVWKRVLQRGDCGPILLVQSPSSKLKQSHSKWIAGGSFMDPDMWGLGCMLEPANIFTCDSTGDLLRLNLESVGSIINVRFRSSNPEEEFRATVNDVLSSRVCCTAPGFVAAMERLYPPRLVASATPAPYTLEDNIRSDPDFIGNLEDLLNELRDQHDHIHTTAKQKTMEQIMELLGLSSPCDWSAANFSRIVWQTLQNGKWYSKAVAIVRCYTCLEDFPFLVELLGKPADLAEVYRIPGLQYSDTLRDGVGLVVSQGGIIGRMTSGTPACKCRVLVNVEL